MELSKCAKCGKLFASTEDLCYNCLAKDLEDIVKVKKYLEEITSSVQLEEISANTGVPEKDILRYISKGHLDYIEHLGHYFNCLHCRTPIKRGKYCEDCMQIFDKIRRKFED